MRRAHKIDLSDDERRELTRLARGRRTAARLIERAQIVLQAATGKENKDIASDLGITPNTVTRWRTRFVTLRIAGIEKDLPRGGRPPKQRQQLESRIIAKTTQETPANATHWSTRSLAKELGTTQSLVCRVWAANGLKPHLERTFKVSNDPDFESKLIDVVGLT